MFDIKYESAILEVTFSQGVFSYNMSDADNSVVQPLQREYSISVNMHNIHSLVKTLYEIVENDYSANKLADIGKVLYQQLIPRDLSDVLTMKRHFLTIITKMQDIPWEMLHDGTDFLGIRHAMGRCIIGRESLKQKRPKLDKKPTCLLISNPSGDLPEAESESLHLLKFLRNKNINCNYIAQNQVSVGEISMELNSDGYDFIHYNGHIERGPEKNDYSFILSGNEYYSLKSVSFLQDFGNPFVFLNGCGGKVDVLDAYGGGQINEGAVIPFIHAGARAVIGSSWRVSDKGARIFAERTYQYFFDGDTIGEAMARARNEIMTDGSQDPTWASFILYGNPCLCFVNPDEMPGLPGKLSRADFSEDGWKALKYASKTAKKSGLVGSAHLFNALLHFKPESFTPLFDAAGVTETEFESMLDEVIQSSEAYSQNAAGFNFSRNTQKILISSSIAAAADITGIDHGHLLQALLDTPEAGIFKIVQEILAYIKKKNKQDELQTEVGRISDGGGNLRKDLFSEECIKALRIAFHYAEKTDGVTTTHLFTGLLSKSGSILQELILSAGISSAELEIALTKLFGYDGDTNQAIGSYETMRMGKLTGNAALILASACRKASGSGRKTEEKDLIEAVLNLECSATSILREYVIAPKILLNHLKNI